MELLDVVNETDQVIGQATKDECHLNPGLMHHVIQFSLVDRIHKQIMITQRSFSKKTDPGKWCFLGEHVLSGESYSEAVKRGVGEELGFTPTDWHELGKHVFHQENQTELVRFFLIEYSGQAIDFDKNEIVQIRWLDTDKFFSEVIDYSEMANFWLKNIDWMKFVDKDGQS